MRRINLTEEQFDRLISETVDKVLNEEVGLVFDVDIKSIPIEILRNAYFDYRLIPSTISYGHPIYNPTYIKEAFGNIAEPDNVIRDISKKYGISERLLLKTEHFHKIYVYAITAKIGINDKLLEDDMKKMGYFLSSRGPIQMVENMAFQALQFEPMCQLQEDVTNVIKEKYDTVYHWAPIYNVADILENGLTPMSMNYHFTYPPRVYLIEGDSTDESRIYLGRLICAGNHDTRNNGLYGLISIDIRDLDESIRFFYDPNSEIGVYTEQPIPPDKLKLFAVEQLKKQEQTDEE